MDVSSFIIAADKIIPIPMNFLQSVTLDLTFLFSKPGEDKHLGECLESAVLATQ